MPPSITFSFTVDAEAPDVMQMFLNGSTGPLCVSLPAVNAGMQIADLSVTTHSGNPYRTPLVLGGADGEKFALSNGGTLPCSLMVGPADIVTGTYSISITAP